MPARPIAASMSSVLGPAQPTDAPVPAATSEVIAAEPPMAPDVPMMELSPEWRDDKFDDVPWFKDKLELMDHFDPIVPSGGQKLSVVKLTTNPCTPAQYDGPMATSAVGKGKQWAVPAIEDNSNYGQSHSKEEEEAEEGEMVMERFQH
ncbi:hypothetical protein C0992_003336, partial [Termitomyces sp. T32_za158]